MKIGDLARHAACTTETVRFYEKEGLLPAADRAANNYRSYGARHLERLRFVRNCRALDMTHEEIHQLLALMETAGADCGGVNELLDAHIQHVDQRIAELLQLKQELDALRQRCQQQQGVDECGILQGLAEMEASARPERHTHLG
ncbi:Cd(II)/Pb(II)-responsive transcriptional regulator [Aquitalea palustris]|uniref:Cd(II)/Pb(II)-responsive transcriptional regulator n=1 Tax=Aquitalea palustris TaxID=2480983 RepID=A0A454JFL7_9NEIS|nr:Cd(II)/Pb(II)-responsive transcriptional regulator [Aquitalea palustris]RMC94561.1 Cd(II)/Pb(II)-responsive transcriptional regulator [Aquitalea palustris]